MKTTKIWLVACAMSVMTICPMAAQQRGCVLAGDTVRVETANGSLWHIAGAGSDGVRCRNVATGKWLRVEKDGVRAIVSMTDSVMSSVLRVAATEGDYTTEHRAGVYPTVRVDGADYYLNPAQRGDGVWQLREQRPEQSIAVEQWSYRHSITTDWRVSSEHIVFAWAGSDAEAQRQKTVLRYWARVTDSTYYYSRADGRRQAVQVRVVTDGNTLREVYGIEPQVEWLSQQEPYSAVSTLRGSAPVADPYGWTLTLTPQGKSPMDVKRNDEYADLADTLQMSLTRDGQEIATASTRVVRKAYHYSDDNRLIANIEVKNSMFGATDHLTKRITPALTLLTGRQLYDAEHTLVGGDTQTQVLSLGDLNAPRASVVDETGKAADWLQVAVNTDDNSLVATVVPNTDTQSRSAQIVLSDAGEEVASVAVTQAAKASTVVAKLIHQAGVGNRMMGIEVGEDEIQPVYTAEKTYYYSSGEWLHLVAQTTTFFGYQRWYDYKTGKDPVFPRAEGDTEDATVWAKPPRGGTNDATGSLFNAINTDFENSQGLYAIHGDGLPAPNRMGVYGPQLVGWNSDTVRRTIACDFSMYADYEVKKDADGNLLSVKEPTLSYRQLFHLRPAADMAKQLAACSESTGKYLEEYHYVAPVGTPIYINTQYAHCYFTDFETEYGYYFYGTDGYLWRVSLDDRYNYYPYAHVKWYQDDTEMTPSYVTSDGTLGYKNKLDYVAVTSDKAGVVTYTVRIPKYQYAKYSNSGAAETKQVLEEDILLARFVVDYKDRSECGPAQVLNSDTGFDDQYDLLALQDFNYDVPCTQAVRFYDKPRAWDKSSYAFCYTNRSGLQWYRNYPQTMHGNSFPSFNEFSIVNKVVPDGNLNWVYEQEQRGGAENGYCLYVDGGKSAGLVATVDIDTVLCAQQKVYCSFWVCDVTPLSQKQYTKPVMVCVVQGRHSSGTDTEWHDVETFNSGELPHDQAGWKHIFFPLESDDNYEEVRLNIYNFASSTAANDFLIDDVALYATKNPLAAYQALTSCSNDDRDVAVIRIDYTNLPESWAHTEVYYQVFNATDKTAVTTNYLHHAANTHGTITIPCHDYDPTDADKTGHVLTDDESGLVHESLAAFVEELYSYTDEDAVLKGYVKHDGDNHYTMYVGHIFTQSDETDGTLNRSKTYEIRLARSEDDLGDDLCSYRTPLPIYDRTSVSITDIDGSVQSGNVCANALYQMNVLVSKSVTEGTQVLKVSAPAVADWLVAYDFDDIFATGTETRGASEREEADDKFLDKYGYTRGEISDAMADMRRLPEPEQPNANYAITRIADLKRDAFVRDANYDIIISLYQRGLLRLSESSRSVYLRSEETARYWIYPITGTVTTTYSSRSLTLEVCNEPVFALVQAQSSNELLTLGPVQHGALTDEQRNLIPAVRVNRQQANTAFSVPVSDMQNVTLATEDCQIVLSDDPAVTGKTLTYTPEYKDNAITFTPNTAGTTLQVGYEYTIRVGMTATSSDNAGCESNAYFTVLVLPDTVVWSPSHSTEWGEDSNWRAVIGGRIQSWGYAPLRTMVAIVPQQDSDALYPVITTRNLNPLDANYTPQACSALRLHKGAKLQNQHLLAYDSVFVDMPLRSARWYSMSAPLQDMVSGDFFIPYDADGSNIESDLDFTVSPYHGNRKGSSAYAFWLSYYNRSVTMLNQNPDNDRDSVSTNIEVFAKSNSLAESLAPGQGFQVLGYGPGDDGENLVIRLPKPDNVYYYFNPDGSQSNRHEVINRNRTGRLAYPETTGNGTMTITLTNEKESRHFLFGNPTMAYIDMQAFFADNNLVESSFRYIDGSSWKTVTPSTATTAAERFVAPMQSVLLTAKTAATSLTLTLSDSHLAATNTGTSDASAIAPRRMQSAFYTPQIADNEVMNITASNAYAAAYVALAVQNTATNACEEGEDVPFTSTSTTPLNLYTLAGTQALMADTRYGISTVPLGFVISGEQDTQGQYLYRTDSLTLAFRLTANWSDECYLCDALTGTRTRIANDTEIRIATPADHQLRYYIQGSYREPSGPDTPTDNTDNPTLSSLNGQQLVALSNSPATVTVIATGDIRDLRAYDLTGRTLLHLHSDAPHALGAVVTTHIPSGMAVIEGTLQSGEKVKTKVIVQ